VAPLQRSHSIKKIADRRGACCANASNAVEWPWKGCAIAYNAMQHVQNKRHDLAVFWSAVGAFWARRVNDVKMPCKFCICLFGVGVTNVF